MDAELARLSSCAVVACLCRDRDDINPGCIKKAVCSKLGVRENDVKVVRHRPEDFLIDFKFPHHRDAAVALKRLPIGTLNIRIKPWRILPYGNHCDLPYHVRLCLEGIPVHAWNKSIAKRAIARDCNLDYVDPSSLRRDDTRALCLWAWTYSPSNIPKVTWLTLTGNRVVVHDGMVPPKGRRGLTFRVIVHLDLVESSPDDNGRPTTRELKWRYGVVDGERVLRDRHNPPPTDNRHERRRDDYNNDRRGHRDDKGRG
jgi:hypothetical protein